MYKWLVVEIELNAVVADAEIRTHRLLPLLADAAAAAAAATAAAAAAAAATVAAAASAEDGSSK